MGPQCARLWRLRWLAPQRQALPDRLLRLRWLVRPAQAQLAQARQRLQCFGWSLWFSARLVVARLQLSCAQMQPGRFSCGKCGVSAPMQLSCGLGGLVAATLDGVV